MVRAALLPLLLLFLAAAAPPQVVIIGRPIAGCIIGAERLPDDAPGLETIRAAHSSFWGAPGLIAALERLGREAQAAGLPPLYIGDLSARHGGPLAGGHVGHQIGLEADVWLDLSPHPILPVAARDDLLPPEVVRPGGQDVDPAHWSPMDVTLLHLAATLPGIDRVLVNPAIKRHLCRIVTGDRSWLRFIRPWWGHAGHMHIRLRCPTDQSQCREGPPPPPPGDGCDATLAWWFTPDARTPPQHPHHAPPVLPAACRAVLGE